MKVSVDISPEYKEPYAIIYTDKVTEDIQRIIDTLSTNESPVTALQNEEDIIVLQPKEIYMVRVENGDTIIYGETQKYRSRIEINTDQPVIYGQHRAGIFRNIIA